MSIKGTTGHPTEASQPPGTVRPLMIGLTDSTKIKKDNYSLCCFLFVNSETVTIDNAIDFHGVFLQCLIIFYNALLQHGLR